MLLFLLAFSHNSIAETLNWSVGIKSWYNDWTIDPEASGVDSDTSDDRWMLGPVIKMDYGRMFAGVSFLSLIGDYHFSNNTWSRTDLDVTAGYRLAHPVALFAGWKYLRGSTNTNVSHRARGPFFGVALNTPVASTDFIAYANFSYMIAEGFLKSDDVNGQREDELDIQGYSIEPGLSWAINARMALNIGYKYQNLRWKNATKDIVSGVSLGFSYALAQ